MTKPYLSYIPHGIDSTVFFPISENEPGNMRKTEKENELKTDYEVMIDFKKNILGGGDFDFVLFFNNRNIRRKMVGDVIMAFKYMCDKLTPEKANKCVLLLHTTPIDQNGTDLPALIDAVCPKYPIMFTNGKLNSQHMNYLYNIADVTINISSAEGFGLATAESLMAGTPIVINILGGLQDQAGFKKENNTYLQLDDYTKDWSTNSNGKFKNHGEWAQVVFPSTISLVGSPPTPYIYDSRCKTEDVTDKLLYFYNLTRNERKELGMKGRQFVMTDKIGMEKTNMCQRFISDMDYVFENWKPIDSYELIKT